METDEGIWFTSRVSLSFNIQSQRTLVYNGLEKHEKVSQENLPKLWSSLLMGMGFMLKFN